MATIRIGDEYQAVVGPYVELSDKQVKAQKAIELSEGEL
eukprot:COSAG05_NODE_14233_length_403_cov_1.529605_1_plen_38_part_10